MSNGALVSEVISEVDLGGGEIECWIDGDEDHKDGESVVELCHSKR